MKIVTYLDANQVLAFFAQYCRRSAGFYPGIRRQRRAAEIEAWASKSRQAETFERPLCVETYRNTRKHRIAGPVGRLP